MDRRYIQRGSFRGAALAYLAVAELMRSPGIATKFYTKPPSQPGYVTGVTRDAAGQVLGGCMVRLFDTITNLPVGDYVSRSDGQYSIKAPGLGSYYAVAYLDGGTPVMGATVNTIVGS